LRQLNFSAALADAGRRGRPGSASAHPRIRASASPAAVPASCGAAESSGC